MTAALAILLGNTLLFFFFRSLLLHHDLTMVQGSEVNAVLVIMFKNGGACNI